MVTGTGVQQIYRFNLGRAAKPAELKKYTGKVTYNTLVKAVKNSKEFKAQIKRVKANPALASNHLPVEMR
jgi:hypothetical protein